MSAWSRPGPPPPGEPYRSQPRPGEYRPPTDPWSQSPTADPWNQPTSGWSSGPTPAYGGPTYPGPPGSPTQPTSPPPRRNLGLYAVVAVLVLLAAAGAGYALYVLSGDDGTPAAGSVGNPTATAGSPGSPSASGTPRDTIGMSAAVAEKDDCLINDGTAEQVQMRIVRCDDEESGDSVFKVLTVVEQPVAGEDDQTRDASAQQLCADIEGYTHHYYEVGEQSSFVLCMAEQG